MPESATDQHKGRVLLEIARESVEHAVLGTPETEHDEGWLWEPGATFVTLRCYGQLRGCLGTLKAREPLVEDLRHNARSVTSRDPRFPPLTPQELAETRVEVSLLSPLEEIPCESEDDAVRVLGDGHDGWYLTYQHHSGTFLPQVWGELARSAGVPAAAEGEGGAGRRLLESASASLALHGQQVGRAGRRVLRLIPTAGVSARWLGDLLTGETELGRRAPRRGAAAAARRSGRGACRSQGSPPRAA